MKYRPKKAMQAERRIRIGTTPRLYVNVIHLTLPNHIGLSGSFGVFRGHWI